MTLPTMSTTPVSAQDAGVVVSGPGHPCGLPRVARVRAKAEFARVFEQGRRVAEPMLALHWLADDVPARLGMAVSRKVDPRAVGRNRIKRQLRDAFRRLRGRLPGGAYVVVARAAAASADGVALRDCLLRLLQRAGALPGPAAAGTMRPACPPPISSPSTPDARG